MRESETGRGVGAVIQTTEGTVRRTSSSDLGRLALLGALQCCAWLIFAVGLISPLTPSEGDPRPGDIAGFVGVPVLLLVTSVRKCRTWPARLFVMAELATVVWASAGVLYIWFR
jgi:hypothetical protein